MYKKKNIQILYFVIMSCSVMQQASLPIEYKRPYAVDYLGRPYTNKGFCLLYNGVIYPLIGRKEGAMLIDRFRLFRKDYMPVTMEPGLSSCSSLSSLSDEVIIWELAYNEEKIFCNALRKNKGIEEVLQQISLHRKQKGRRYRNALPVIHPHQREKIN
ncbi:hypothetical protein HYV11_01735 [Candidatus Dependentiae bacterium]|nr:hypothetical protein [Candidatus Dependentiae bacterium]